MMKRINSIILILAVIFVILLPWKGKAAESGGIEPETSKTIENISVLNLYGSWFEMGKQYGELAQRQLREVFEFCDAMIEAKEGNADRAVAIVGAQVEQMPYTIRAFFRGAAETSGLTVDQLYVANAVERIAGLPKCSMAAAWGDYAKDGMVVGRNYD